MNRELIEALNMVEREKGIAKEILIEAIESAILSAYKKDQGKSGNLRWFGPGDRRIPHLHLQRSGHGSRR